MKASTFMRSLSHICLLIGFFSGVATGIVLSYTCLDAGISVYHLEVALISSVVLGGLGYLWGRMEGYFITSLFFRSPKNSHARKQSQQFILVSHFVLFLGVIFLLITLETSELSVLLGTISFLAIFGFGKTIDSRFNRFNG